MNYREDKERYPLKTEESRREVREKGSEIEGKKEPQRRAKGNFVLFKIYIYIYREREWTNVLNGRKYEYLNIFFD